jgi:hypothetical protein
MKDRGRGTRRLCAACPGPAKRPARAADFSWPRRGGRARGASQKVAASCRKRPWLLLFGVA